MTAYEQRSYPGAAADTVLTADITASATAFAVTAGTGNGYPDGTGGPFFVIIDYDNSKAEKIRCSGRVNDTFTVAGTGGGRAQDGTAAVAHTAPAKVRACITATDVQEANRAAANTVGLVTTKGDLLTGSGANTLARTAAGANGTIPIFDSTQPGGVRAGANPSLVGSTLDATSTIGGVSGTTLAADHAAWAGAYSPGWTAGATPTFSTNAGRYLQMGKTCIGSAQVVTSGTAIAGANTTTLPVAVRAGTPTGAVMGIWRGTINATVVWGHLRYTGSGTTVGLNNGAASDYSSAIASADSLFLQFWYETA